MPLTVTSQREQALADELAALVRLGVRAPYIFTAGTIEPRKDLATIVDAFERVRARHRSLSLVIAGRAGWLPNSAQAWLLSRPGITRLGHVSDADLDVLYRHADAFVAASIYEGFNLTVLEALAHGCPAIVSLIPAHREVAGDAARYFRPGDVHLLVDNIYELIRDRGTRAQLGQAGIRRAELYDVDSAIRGHLAAYKQAVREPRLSHSWSRPST